jgi:16S rRNA processing protein RimM
VVEKRHGDVVVKIRGIEDREEIGRFVGWEVVVPRKNAARRKRGEYYIADLIGCVLIFEDRTVGSVTGVSDIGYVDLIEITSEENVRSLVPFKEEFIGRVDVKNRRIELKEGWIID